MNFQLIIGANRNRAHADLQTRDVERMIIRLKERMEDIRQAEMSHVRCRLGQLSREQESAIEALTQGIVDRVMHYPISALRTARGDQAATLLSLVERLFNIPSEGKAQGSSPSRRSRLSFAGLVCDGRAKELRAG